MRRIPPPAPRTRVSHERWLVSYADFMTLLFAFFATMYAISGVDARALANVAHALQDAFDASVRAHHAEAALVRAERLEQAPPSMADVEDQVNAALAAALASEQLRVIVERRGVTLSIPEAGAFAVGRDELSGAAEALVSRVADTLSRFPNPVRVEGHTDDMPIHTMRFVSNWDLSAARASRVVELLIRRGVAPERLSAAGYAEFQPRVPNTSAETRASNRRIDLVILNAATSRAEEPAAATGTP